MSQYRAIDVNKHGTQFVLRTMSVDDRFAMLKAYKKLSERSLYLRFFRVVPEPTLQQLEAFTRVNAKYTIALCIYDIQEQELVAAGRLIKLRNNPNIAELSCIVVDDMHGQGLATLLLTHLISLAQKEGIDAIVALVHRENKAMVRVLKKSGYQCDVQMEDGEYEINLSLRHPIETDSNATATLGNMHPNVL